MKRIPVLLPVLILNLVFLMNSCDSVPDAPPNILWLVSEDNSPFLGCYGDTLASTPNLDALAARGHMYIHAFANAPVCAPARNTIITGVHANSNGNQHMRSYYPKSDEVRFYPKYLREAGYYCTNCSKEDYNTVNTEGIWDESSPKAHYNNRAEGQPFFHIYNIFKTHESSLHTSIPDDQLVHKPEDMTLPPYHPDTKVMRHDWAQYYDKVSSMDSIVGNYLRELEEAGLSENTIVFYYADHGGVVARSKRFVYETGTRVPFIVYIPDKYKHLRPGTKGSKEDRLVSFVDLAPTMLSLCGLEVPEYLQGNAFLGKHKSPDPEYVHMFRDRMDERYDMSRAVSDGKYRYVRNYMPFRIYLQKLEYLWRAPSVRSWEQVYKDGKCNEMQSAYWNTKPAEELFATENDPWEVHNLADDPEYREVLLRMRKENLDWLMQVKDCGFIPEAEMNRLRGDRAPYDFVRSGEVDLDRIINSADFASMATKKDLPVLLSMLKDKESSVRYWAAAGLLMLGQDATSATSELLECLNDESMNVQVMAAEALYGLGEKQVALSTLKKVILSGDEFAATHAMNVVECNNINDQDVIDCVLEIRKDLSEEDYKKFDVRIAGVLMEKWGLVAKN